MVLNPSQIPMVVRDNHYGAIFGDIPKFYTTPINIEGCCLSMDSKSNFKEGLHFMVEVTHKIGINCLHIHSLDEAYSLFESIKFSAVFFSSIINKLELTEDSMYARAVLAHIIGYEEKNLLRIQNRIEELKKSKS